MDTPKGGWSKGIEGIFPYPLVKVYITMERSTIFLMGKLTVKWAFSSSQTVNVYQAGSAHACNISGHLGAWGCGIFQRS
jgi:hypothetical protein